MKGENLLERLCKSQKAEILRLNQLIKDLNIPVKMLNYSQSLTENEIRIDSVHNSIREEWLLLCFEFTKKMYKSPIDDGNNNWHTTIGKTKIFFDYERTMDVKFLEEKIYRSFQSYCGSCFLYNNGMSSINNILLILQKFNTKYLAKMSIHLSYYENVALADLYSKQFNIILLKNNNKIDNQTNFYVIEPVACQTLKQLDIVALLDKICKHSFEIKFIVLDNTLMGSSFDKESLLKKYKQSNLVFIFTRSLLKVDQLGFELCNAGISEWYFPQKFKSLSKALDRIAPFYRGITGSSLTFFEINLLDSNQLIRNSEYSEEILSNTQKFMQSIGFLQAEAVIKQVFYPAPDIGEFREYYRAPFILVSLKENNQDYYSRFKFIINKILKIYGLDIGVRTSFGFRNITYHTIAYKNKSNVTNYVFRVSIGIVAGLKYQLILEVFKYFSRVSTMQEKEIKILIEKISNIIKC